VISSLLTISFDSYFGRHRYQYLMKQEYGDANVMSRSTSCRPPGFILFGTIALSGLLIVTACGPTQTTSLNNNDWHEFQGTWTATGSRNVMRLDGDRRASIATYTGSLVLAGPLRPGLGFQAEAIVFSDNATGILGRAVWIDEHGDKVFSELRGEGVAAKNKIIGTFAGGTGRYAGATGTYEFSWQFMIENEDGNVQGQSLGLKGRVRIASQQAASSREGPQS